ncbi:YbaB/EbfC family nucleoid-associated protein [Nocardia farcinica]|uniref:YbaB/EbfC family nucleoid-associated protein n=1 Tax=Nocardia farcinica TaxID=37329 RepID=UPI0018936C14|nr:YbaB/EbfC family nucleoid-associated protein [Nocardia farcinica]MBF6188931.1 YbaB/EbfC family nucleoid-associated protein [Nocardia farcinica]MBF6410432.1 YbaB/EbfC family nucleoid-associated protein [Nocardia farcinica]
MNRDENLDTDIAELTAKAHRVREALAAIKGTGRAANGSVTAIVDSAGRLRDLKLSREALKWGDRLPSLILTATAAAETDAARQADRAAQALTTDPRVQAGLRTVGDALAIDDARPSREPLSEDEIQAADDAYFDRRRRNGWTE